MIRFDTLILIVCAFCLIGISFTADLMLDYYEIGYGFHPLLGGGLIAILLVCIALGIKLLREYNEVSD